MKVKNLWNFVLLLVSASLLGACDQETNTPETKPTVRISEQSATESSITFSLSTTDAQEVKWMIWNVNTPPDAASVLEQGTPAQTGENVSITISDLQAESQYHIVAAARNIKETDLAQATLSTTATPIPDPTVTLSAGECTDTSLSFSATSTHTATIKWVCIVKDSRDITTEVVLNNGKTIEANTTAVVTVEDLNDETDYEIYAAVIGENGTQLLSEALEMRTERTIQTYPVEADYAIATVSGETLKNYYVTFMNTQSGYTVKADFYSDADVAFLPSGTYTLGEFNAGEIAQIYTTFMQEGVDDEAKKFTEGQITVTATPNEETYEVHYSIEGEFTLEETGDRVTLTYEGIITGISLPKPDDPDDSTIIFEVSPSTQQPERKQISNEEPGEYYLKFYDANWNELTLDIMADPELSQNGNTHLPDGLYHSSDENAVGTFLLNYTNISIYSPYWGGTFTSCSMNVAREGEVYTLEFVGTAEYNGEERTVKMNWSGEIKNMARTN